MTTTTDAPAARDARWRRLAAIDFDDPKAAFSFTQRLARDNGWRASYAARVVEEYRRFAYLSVAAGHETTPSDEVDQAWHLHLTYTRHYGGVFADALGAPLHHNPTAGGDAEKTRYADNYAATLCSYERQFGERPPADIWPAARVRFGEAPYMQRVNRRRNFVIPKNRALPLIAAASGGAALTASVAAQDAAGGAADILAFFNENPVIGYGGVIVVILLILMAIRGATQGKTKKGDGSSGAAVGGTGGGKSGGKGDGDGGGDGGSGCSSGCGGCGGG